MTSLHDIIYKPRNGLEMQKAVYSDGPRHVPITLYSDLCRKFKGKDPATVIRVLYTQSPKHVILLQNPRNMLSGHWMGLSIMPSIRKVYFFSSYGGKPDEEKNRWIDEAGRMVSGQDMNCLNDALYRLHQEGWEVHYNDYPFQFEHDKTATCGIWTAAFLNSNVDPDDFAKFVRRHKLTTLDFYKAYFVK